MNATMNMPTATFFPRALTPDEIEREYGVVMGHIALAHTLITHAGLELDEKDLESAIMNALRELLAAAGERCPHPWGRVKAGAMSDGFKATVQEAIRKRLT